MRAILTSVAVVAILLVVTNVWLLISLRAFVEGGGAWTSAALMTFVCGGFWFTAVSESFRLRRTAYGVTDRRVIIRDSWIGTRYKCIPYRTLSGAFVDGSREFGTVRCARTSMDWKNQARPGRNSTPALFNRIVEAGAVCDLILEQKMRMKKALKSHTSEAM